MTPRRAGGAVERAAEVAAEGARQVAATRHARACFLRACELDVAVRKPGNVSRASAGHGMHADLFVASAQAAAAPLFEAGLGLGLGARIEAAVDATWAVAGCNTNLGILLLCAPIAMAVERAARGRGAPTLRAAIGAVLAESSVADAAAAYRAIARARPGGLGSAPAQDVHATPSVDLRSAMTLAADRDSIARQYRDAYAELFDTGLPALGPGFSLGDSLGDDPSADTVAAVQRLYLTLLARMPDSHIVRIHGEPVAHIVMSAAQGFLSRPSGAAPLDNDPAFHAWDSALKAHRINPGTTADLTVATLLIAGVVAGLTASPRAVSAPVGSRWHGT